MFRNSPALQFGRNGTTVPLIRHAAWPVSPAVSSPGGHGRQAMDWSAELKLFTGQGIAVAAPVTLTNVPGGDVKQLDCP